MNRPLSPEQMVRLHEARLRQQQARERIEDLATNSIMAWLTRVLAPFVRSAVRGAVDWLLALFR